ncbi:ABC transporter ATP-binding protein [Ancylomarina euxinus]|uniref:ABC transporter ATP-binding protein n=1 Tax=Ancylomarina euxinus TaxID=2283627 RepID=A0A425Y1W3_9BACT|nr:ABC transporter ATP-binding protein [Ancylomarina euxinus]MCZ4695021.1 ABC transporter ATP-binding protein [Ancylomarina euxinus]MUP15043.1 ATP-binding cassette domain-containing protein [Ancylomarina euxinus]RRG21930.1 ABC transporter ATP-binding protein [Ancylomarina euxinus]
MLIEIKDLRKKYIMGEMEVEALRGVNLNISTNEFVSIMGPSGSGKSTLMNILGCLDTPSSGQYLFDSIDISSRTDDELSEIRNQKIGFIFQTFNLLPKLDALQNVELPLIYSGVEKHLRKDLAKKALKRLGLENRMNHKPNELSGGQRQRVAIARALVTNPGIILADEPTGNLDTKTGFEIMEIFKELHQEGNTIILITHEPEIAEQADRGIIIRDGLITKDALNTTIISPNKTILTQV